MAWINRAFAEDASLNELGEVGNTAYGPLGLKLAEGMTIMPRKLESLRDSCET